MLGRLERHGAWNRLPDTAPCCTPAQAGALSALVAFQACRSMWGSTASAQTSVFGCALCTAVSATHRSSSDQTCSQGCANGFVLYPPCSQALLQHVHVYTTSPGACHVYAHHRQQQACRGTEHAPSQTAQGFACECSSQNGQLAGAAPLPTSKRYRACLYAHRALPACIQSPTSRSVPAATPTQKAQYRHRTRSYTKKHQSADE